MSLYRFRIKRIIVVLMTTVFVICSCGPSRQPAVDISKYEGIFPTELTAEVRHEQSKLRWRTNRGDAPIMGYNLYLSENKALDSGSTSGTLAEGISPVNTGAYPGDKDPSTDYETFLAADLIDGVTYYAAVTIVYLGGEESPPSNMIEFVCHPSGEFSLKQRYSGERDGYSFSRADYVASDDLENHIYYVQIREDDYLLSPSRLDNILKSVKFYPLRIKTIEDRFDPPTGPGANKIKIHKGDGCLLRTKAGQYAKIIVKNFSGSGNEREVSLEYSFMPAPGYTDF
jgi:hypothetical protein